MLSVGSSDTLFSLWLGVKPFCCMLQKGKETMGSSDLGMADTLYHFMVGGHKRPLVSFN